MAADATLSARRELAAAIVARTEAQAAVTNCERAIEAATLERRAAFARRERLQEEHAEQQRVQGGPAGADADRYLALAAGLALAPVVEARDIPAEITAADRDRERVIAALKVMEERKSDEEFRLTLARSKVGDAVRAVITSSTAAAAVINEFNTAVEAVLTASAKLNALARSDPGRFAAILARAPLVPPGARLAP